VASLRYREKSVICSFSSSMTSCQLLRLHRPSNKWEIMRVIATTEIKLTLKNNFCHAKNVSLRCTFYLPHASFKNCVLTYLSTDPLIVLTNTDEQITHIFETLCRNIFVYKFYYRVVWMEFKHKLLHKSRHIFMLHVPPLIPPCVTCFHALPHHRCLSHALCT
jgi:hypothetical protein